MYQLMRLLDNEWVVEYQDNHREEVEYYAESLDDDDWFIDVEAEDDNPLLVGYNEDIIY